MDVYDIPDSEDTSLNVLRHALRNSQIDMPDVNRPRRQDEGPERSELLKSMESCEIAGGELMSLTMLRYSLSNCHVHSMDPQRVLAQENAILSFFSDGAAVLLASEDRKSFFAPRNLVRLFPVPREFGFLMCTSAEEHCGYTLTSGAVRRMCSDSAVLEVYSRGVYRIMDAFNVPPATQNPSLSATELVKRFGESTTGQQYSLCSLFYRMLASTYFLNQIAFGGLCRVFSRSMVDTLTQDFPVGTCRLNRAINYDRFMNELAKLSTMYEEDWDETPTSFTPASLASSNRDQPEHEEDGESEVDEWAPASETDRMSREDIQLEVGWNSSAAADVVERSSPLSSMTAIFAKEINEEDEPQIYDGPRDVDEPAMSETEDYDIPLLPGVYTPGHNH
jgi:hypothetical protein